ncbi:hypothetical protein D9M70_577570 [compost metagenome]
MEAVASTSLVLASCTKAVVASWVVLVPAVAVAALGTPPRVHPAASEISTVRPERVSATSPISAARYIVSVPALPLPTNPTRTFVLS